MKIAELGEFGLIDRVAKLVNRARDNNAASWQNLLIGIGDDVAAWRGDSSIQLAKVDSLVEGVHFTLDIISWEDLGWKALAINLSDIASKGGVPAYALVSLALPPDTDVEDVVAFYRGMLKLARMHGVAVVGGNMSRAPVVFIDVMVMGNSPGDSIPTRSAAVPGDQIAVTGYLGSAAAGLEMLTRKLKFSARAASYLRNAFARPAPRLLEGRLLVKYGVKAAIDVSDGLLADLGHICEMSRVGARLDVDRIPIHPAVMAGFGDRALEVALSGGEDYQLLFTARPDVIQKVKEAASCPVTVIGEIVADKKGRITLVDSKGRHLRPRKTGWDHFTST